jgi:hypothetical protein
LSKKEQIFWSKVDKSSGHGPYYENNSLVRNNCWEWNGCKHTKGYGLFWGYKKQTRAHRISWLLTNGDPGKFWVLHHCDNPSCVNPSHLFLGTHDDNMQDRNKKERQTKGEKNGRSKIDEQKVLDIRKRYSNGERQNSIAMDYSISQNQISDIVNRKRWKHI